MAAAVASTVLLGGSGPATAASPQTAGFKPFTALATCVGSGLGHTTRTPSTAVPTPPAVEIVKESFFSLTQTRKTRNPDYDTLNQSIADRKGQQKTLIGGFMQTNRNLADRVFKEQDALRNRIKNVQLLVSDLRKAKQEAVEKE